MTHKQISATISSTILPFNSTLLWRWSILHTWWLCNLGRDLEIAEISWSISRQSWQKSADSSLILLVLWVFLRSDQLCEPSRSLKKEEIRNCADKSPIVQDVCGPATPLVKNYPDGLLGSKIWVTGPRPESRYNKSTIKILLITPVGHFGSLLVILFVTLKPCKICQSWFAIHLGRLTPLLLVRKELHKYQCYQSS